MKIAYLVSQYPAPSHTFIRREVEALRGEGLHVDTFSVRPPAEEEYASVDADALARTHFLLADRVAIVRAHLRHLTGRPTRYARTLRDALRHRNPGARAALWSLFHFAEAITLADELERRGIDHLHNHFANSGAVVGYLASRHLDLPWSLTLHGPSEFDHSAGPLLAAKIAHARFVPCASHYVKSQALREIDPSLAYKLFIVRCAVELGRCPPRRTTGPRGPVRILHVGRLAADKGQVGLLEGFAAALASGADAELWIAGDGPLRGHLEARAAELGVSARCRWLGRLSEAEVLTHMADADIFAMSSLMEGLPVVLMEAMAVGVPVVAPAVAGIPELVEDGQSGLLFPAGDFQALGRALNRIVHDGALRERLAAEGSRRVRAEFSMPEATTPLLGRFAAARNP